MCAPCVSVESEDAFWELAFPFHLGFQGRSSGCQVCKARWGFSPAEPSHWPPFIYFSFKNSAYLFSYLCTRVPVHAPECARRSEDKLQEMADSALSHFAAPCLLFLNLDLLIHKLFTVIHRLFRSSPAFCILWYRVHGYVLHRVSRRPVQHWVEVYSATEPCIETDINAYILTDS